MANVEATGFQVGGDADIEHISDELHHYAHHQELDGKPSISPPFVLYLCEKFLVHFFIVLIYCHSDDRREEDVLLRTPSEKSRVHKVSVAEILRFALDDIY